MNGVPLATFHMMLVRLKSRTESSGIPFENVHPAPFGIAPLLVADDACSHATFYAEVFA